MSAIGQPGLENVWSTIGAFLTPNEQTLLPETAKIIAGKKQGFIGVPNLAGVPVVPLNTIRIFLTTKENIHLSQASQELGGRKVSNETRTALLRAKAIVSLSKSATIDEWRVSAKATTILTVATAALRGIVTGSLADLFGSFVFGAMGHAYMKHYIHLHASNDRPVRKLLMLLPSTVTILMLQPIAHFSPPVAAGIGGLVLYNLYRTSKS